MFYHPSLFHMAPTYDRIVPLAIADVVRSKNVLQVYGVTGVAEHKQGFVMVNNYPIKELKIAGRLLSYAYNSYDQGMVKSPNNFYMLNIDDCSGDSLLIRVKILESKALFSPHDVREDLLVEVTGTVQYVYEFGKQVKGTSAKIIGVSTDLDVEIAWWSQVLEARRHLLHPWKYIHPKPDYDSNVLNNDTEKLHVESMLSSRDRSAKLQKSTLELSSTTDVLLPSVLDSVTLTRAHRSRKKNKDLKTPNTIECIDLTSSDTEVVCKESAFQESVCLEPLLPNLPIMKSFLLVSFSQDSQHSSQGNEMHNYDNCSPSQESVIIIN